MMELAEIFLVLAGFFVGAGVFVFCLGMFWYIWGQYGGQEVLHVVSDAQTAGGGQGDRHEDQAVEVPRVLHEESHKSVLQSSKGGNV